MLHYASLYWQSRSKSQAEVIGIAKNFTARNLSVGVIVIDLGPPNAPPYYRLDPARFPDVAAMSKQVAALTGADLMPNLKPTSVTSSDCPACGSGHSAAACRLSLSSCLPHREGRRWKHRCLSSCLPLLRLGEAAEARAVRQGCQDLLA